MKWIDHIEDVLQRTPGTVVVDSFAAAQALPQGTTAVVRGVNFRTEDGLFRVALEHAGEGAPWCIWDMRSTPRQPVLTGITELRRALVVGEIVARSRSARALLVLRHIVRTAADRLGHHIRAERGQGGEAQ